MWKQRVAKYSFAVAMMVGAFVTCGGNASAAVDTCSWTGATNANWSTSSNWSCTTDGASAPGNGDTVTLPAGASNTAMNNDIAGLSLAAVTVNGTGYSLGGNSLGLSSSNPLTSVANVSFSNNIAFTTTSNVFIRPATGTTITFNGTTSFATTGAFEVNVGLPGEAGTADFVGNVSGTAGSQFIASEGATITIRGANTVTATEVGVELGGKFTCVSATCFGNAANTILIADGVVRAMSTGSYSNPIVTGTASVSTHAYLAGYETATFTGNITVNDDLSIQQISDNKTLTVNGNISLAGDKLYLKATGLNSKTVINGNISGNFGVDVSHSQGTIVLGGNNTYTGITDVYGSTPGYLIVTNANGLGASTASAYTNIASGSTVDFAFSAAGTVAERFNVWGDGAGGNGAIVASDGGGTPTLTGNIVLQSNATIGSYATAFNSFNVNSVISGNYNLTLKGSSTVGGTINLGGATGNSYVGTTTIDGAGIVASKTSGKAITGDINVVATTTNEAALTLSGSAGNNDVLADTAIVTLTNNGSRKAFLQLLNNETFGMLSGNGEVAFGLVTSTTIGGANASGAFSGTIARINGSVSKNGTGTWDLTGANILSGGGNGPTINVNDGIVKVGGNLSAVIAMVNSGGTLMGTGSLDSGFINTGGTLAIGNSPGCLTFSSLTLASGANYNQDITGTTACSGYDKATVTGAVDLAGATLNISQLAGFNPAANLVFTIIDGTSVTGTFAGLANGAVFAVNGVNYRINYTATGEVTLTVVASSVTPTASTPTTTLANTGTGTGVVSVISVSLMALALLTMFVGGRRLLPALRAIRA